MTRRSRSFAAALVFIATNAVAATFLIPADDDLVRASRAAVVATAGTSFSRWTAGGWIETVTEMTVEESIKGSLQAGEKFSIVELGGTIGGLTYAVAGSPSWSEGERSLLFLELDDRGEWVTKNMAVGRFRFVPATHAADGEAKLVRDAASLCGWNTDGTPHHEPVRNARAFLDFIREVAAGEQAAAGYLVTGAPAAARAPRTASTLASAAASTYVMTAGGPGFRWPNFPSPQQFRSRGTQPGAPGGGLTALQRGLAAWTDDPSSNVVLQYGGPTTAASTSKSDGVNSVLFNDPANEIPGSYSPVGGATLAIGGVFATGSHTFNGEQFLTVIEADLVVQDGISGPGLTGNGFDHVVAHELGHCIAIRHSDEPPAGGTSTTNALMNSSVAFDNDPTGASLGAWDREAIGAVYGGGGAPACSSPQITEQPKSLDLTGGSDVVLSVTATGTPPLQYQWYAGSKGNTASPVAGGAGALVSVRPSVTTSYWVRVSSACPPPADSNVAIVTVNGCPAVSIDVQPSDVTVLHGKTATVSFSASGGTLSYQWYIGESGDRAVPLAGARSSTLSFLPVASSRYWAEATNSCGASAQTNTVVITVQPCSAPAILVQPAGGEAACGDQFTMALVALGTAPLQISWFEGERGDTSTPLLDATGASVSVRPMLASRTFWARVTNECGEADSESITATVVQGCRAPVIVQQPESRAVPPGSPAILGVKATGTSLVYRWYSGQKLDYTRPVGGSSPSLYTGPVTSERQYWVKVSNGCGPFGAEALSNAATVTPTVARRRGVR